MASLTDLAARHGLAVIQHACQAVGAEVAGRPLGSHGTAVYSFYATKNLTTVEGATGVYYPVPVLRQPAYARYAATRCPNSERASADMYSVPVHHSLSDGEVETVARAVAAL
jgi:dTDP-4-amino-4,6-dideoxygalactose transaminase